MIEVEIKVEVKHYSEVEAALQRMGFAKGNLVKESDYYFDKDLRIDDKALRVRKYKDMETGQEEAFMTYKGPKLDEVSMTRQEVEIQIDNADTGKEFLEALGYELIAPVVKNRQYYKKDEMTACLDRVENLGDYLELEIVVAKEPQREDALKKVVDVVNALGYNEEAIIKTSYLSMLQKNMLHIRKAAKDDYPDVREFYYELTDSLASSQYSPGWERDIYPTQEWLIESIEKQKMYLGELNGKIVSCMVVNQEYNDGYKEIDWKVDAKDSELLVIHALGVAADYSGRGFAKQMVRYVIDMAKEQGIKAIRLDVLEGNLPAEKSYVKVGFEYVGTVPMFYEDTGWTNYKAFEYAVRLLEYHW